MRLDSKYYSFCKELGFLKENYSHQTALNSIKASVKSTKGVDPKFAEAVDALTLSSPEISMRVCALYNYDIDVDYVVSGRIKNTKLYDFGYSGVPDLLYVSKFKGDGDYTVVKDVSTVPYAIFNEKNLFTLDEMKSALTKTIEKNVPASTTSFQSKNWSVSMYFVPLLTIVVKYGGKDYAMNYNLHNGYYHWNNPDDPVLVTKGKNARAISFLIKALGVILAGIGVIKGITGLSDQKFVPALVAAGMLALIIMLCKKTTKSKSYYEKLFVKEPKKSMLSAIIHSIFIAAIGFMALIFSLAL